MTSGLRKPSIRAIGIALLASFSASAALEAQVDDFLFGQPNISLFARFGYSLASANSDIFDFTSEELTVNKSDFGSFAFHGEFAIRLEDRLDLGIGVGIESSTTTSEFREFVGTDDLPIVQQTTFGRYPVTVGAKYYLADRGRSIGEFAWIPAKLAPYVGAGGGIMPYRFVQEGEFVDFQTLDIFLDRFESTGVGVMGYVAAGLDVSLGKRWIVNGDARYSFASAGMDQDFVDFDNIDLSGLRFALGFGVRL